MNVLLVAFWARLAKGAANRPSPTWLFQGMESLLPVGGENIAVDGVFVSVGTVQETAPN